MAMSRLAATLVVVTDQLLLFASEGAEPTVDDLDGLMFGPGHVVRRADTARLSVLVDDVWRAEALLAEFEARDLRGEFAPSREDSGKLVVRTDFTERLTPLAARWAAGGRARQAARLSGAALRLWVIAAGRAGDDAFLLPLPPTDQDRWQISGAALAARGLRATMVGPRGGGPAYRITSHKRLAKLALLVGEPPSGAPPYCWP